MYSTYSFADVSAVVSHPSFGQYIATGKGLGSIVIDPATSNTIHDRASDGSIMISKIVADDGTVAFEIQQTSDFSKWLLRLYNYLKTASSDQWAGISVVVRSAMMQELTSCTGVSFDKRASRPYKAQGQNITWNLMASVIQSDVA